MTESLAIAPIYRIEPRPCCHCKRISREFKFNPIDVHPVEDHPPQFFYTIDGADCPLCGGHNYFLEICAVPDAPSGRSLFDDNCWEGKFPSYYSASLSRRYWQIVHYEDVRDVFFAGRPDENELLLKCAWLDMHFFPTFDADEFDEAIEKVRTLAHDVQPAILALRW